MGIKQLNKIIKKYAPNAIKEIDIRQLQTKKIAIDSPILMYKYRYAAKNNNNSSSHIHGFVQRVCFYLKHGILPIFVFDGVPPIEKKDIINKRNNQKVKVETKIQALIYYKSIVSKSTTNDKMSIHEFVREASTYTVTQQKYKINKDVHEAILLDSNIQELIGSQDPNIIEDEIDKLNKQVTHVTKTHRHECKYLLKLLGIPVIEANGEAENTCASLQKKGIVDYTFTEDSDALTFGAPKVLKSAKKIEKVIEIDLETVLKELELDMPQFVDFCILSGCDYSNTIPSVGPITSLNLIKEHNNIETILEVSKEKYKIPENFDYKTARMLFNQNPLQEENYDISLRNIQKEKLYEFIVNELKLNEYTYKNIIRKINKSLIEYNKINTPPKNKTLLNYFSIQN